MPYIGQRPSKGDENNFKILDDISSYTLTFDGSDATVVSAANDTITSLSHRFVQGQRVTYTDGDGSAIAGLTDATVYFIIKEDHNTIKLATSASNASNGVSVNITNVGSGSSHTLNAAFDGINTKFKATHTSGQKAKITRSAQLVISMNGVIQQPHDTATPSTGFGFDLDGTIVFSQAPVSTDIFWAHVLTNNNVTFDISNNDIDNFTGDGSTVSFNLSKSPPDNRNILVTVDGVVQYPNDPDGTERSYTVVGNVLTFSVAPALGTEVQVRHIGFAGSTSGGGGVTSFYGRTGAVVLKSTDNITVNDAAITGNATVTGDLTVNGTTTTLDTILRAVDKLEVAADNTTVGVAITQSGSGDILNLYDGATEVFSVADGGNTTMTGDLDVDGLTNLDDGNVSGVVTFTNTPSAIDMNDNSRISFGTSLKTSIFYNAPESKTYIRNWNDTLHIGYRNTEIYHTNQARLTFDSGNTFSNVVNTNFSGANYNALWIPASNTFRLNDNAKLALGSQADAEIYHNGSNFYIDNDTGHFYIRNNVAADVDKNIYIQAKSGEQSISCGNDGEVVLFSNSISASQAKLQTTGHGVYVTGIGTFTDKLSVTGSQNSQLTNNQLTFDRAGYSYIDQLSDAGSLVFRVKANNTIALRLDNAAQAIFPQGVLSLGTQNTSSGHINAFEVMTFNIDSDNDDTNRYFAFYKDGNSGAGTQLLKIEESGIIEVKDSAVNLAGNAPSVKGKIRIGGVSDSTTAGGIEFHTSSGGGGGYGTRITSDASANMHFHTRSNHSAWSERLRITSDGTLESYSTNDTTPNIKWRSDDTNWYGALNQSVHGGTITSFLSCGGDWSADGTTYSATKALAAYPTSAIAVHNQYNNNWGTEFVFLTKAGGSTTTDGTVSERLRITSAGAVVTGGTTAQASDAVTLMPDGEVTAAGFYFSNNIASPMNSDGIRRHTTGTICIDTGSQERLRIDSSGQITNTGIATSFVTTMFAANFAKLDLRGTNIANSNHYLLSYGAGHANNQEFHMVNTLDDLVFRTGSSSPTERLRITESGDLVIGGHTGVIEPGGYASHLEIHGTGTDAGISVLRYNNSAGGPTIVFGKSRNATIGSITKVQEDDNLGKIEFYGVDTDWEPGASIRAFADGEWRSGSVGAEDNTDSPGRLEFHTTPNGSDNLQERLRITSGGIVLINDTTVSTNRGDAPLQIETGANGNTLNLRARSADNAYAYINFQNNAGSQTSAEIHMQRNSQNGGQLVFATAANNANNPTTRLWIDKDGNVILGHSAANGRLQVNSGTNSAVGDATNPAFQIGGTTNYRFAIHTTNEQGIIANKNGDDGIAFHTKTGTAAGAFGEAVRIDANGNVGIGNENPTAKLLIQDDYDTETVILKLRNYKSSVNTKPTLRFEASTSSGQGANSDIQGLAGTDAGGSASANESGMKFIVRHGGSGTEREAFSILKDGNIHFPNGQGIDFSATEGTSNTSNENSLLDDYEEGTFVPQLNGMGTVTYDLRAGRYTKIGNVCYFQLRINLGTRSGGSHAHVTNMPFTQSSATIQYPHCTFFAIEDVQLSSNHHPVAQFINSEIYLYQVGYQSSSNYSNIDENQIKDSSQWGIFGFYYTTT